MRHLCPECGASHERAQTAASLAADVQAIAAQQPADPGWSRVAATNVETIAAILTKHGITTLPDAVAHFAGIAHTWAERAKP